MIIKELYKLCENTNAHTVFEIHDRGVFIGKYTYSDYNLTYELKPIVSFKLSVYDGRGIVQVHYW